MKVLLINPPGSETDYSSYFPIGLGYIAKALLNENHHVDILNIVGINLQTI